jgi:recombinational DNA repair protein (RecF pathway)
VTPWDQARAVAEATPQCARCHAPRPPANLTLIAGERVCPECLYRKAEYDITHQVIDRPKEG